MLPILCALCKRKLGSMLALIWIRYCQRTDQQDHGDHTTTRVLYSDTVKTPGVGEACEEETEEYEDSIGCKVGTASVHVGNPRCCSYCRSQESSRRRRLSAGPGGTLQTSQIQRSLSTATRARCTATASLLWRNIVAMCMHSFTDSAHKSRRKK